METATEEIQADQNLLHANCPVVVPPHAPKPEDVWTYHYDMTRTGWSLHERSLTASVKGTLLRRFVRSHTVALDEKVSAQPLVIPTQFVTGVGTRDVVYVVTEADTVYAIDAKTGAILLSRTVGQPVSNSLIGCGDNGALQGVTSTPLIDTEKHTMYLVSFEMDESDPAHPKPVHKLHMIDLSTLADMKPPVVVSATGSLVDGTSSQFSSQIARQRSGLVAANGNIYAAFASHCDHNADQSRGWLLGWNTTTLTPLAANHLINREHPYKITGSPFYLSSIWMSGYGVSSDSDGNLYAVTGNSGSFAPGGNCATTPPIASIYANPDNLAESAVKISDDLKKTLASFTPDNQAWLDCTDNDFGSGGIMLLPDQPGSTPHLGVAAGKDGKMFLLDRSNMHRLGTYDIGGCWCGPSYFEGSDGTGRIVSSGGSELEIWKVVTSSTAPASLVEEHSTTILNGQDGGFFTSISSNLKNIDTTIIWAVGRPTPTSPTLTLYAFDAKGVLLHKGDVGPWNVNGMVYSMPVVANGRVYVGGNRELAIFEVRNIFFEPGPVTQVVLAHKEPLHAGVVTAIVGSTLTVQRKDGSTFTVDAEKALAEQKTVPLSIGKSIAVQGVQNAKGTVEATSISHGESVLQ